MKATTQIQNTNQDAASLGLKNYSYNELIELFDNKWKQQDQAIDLEQIKALDKAFDNCSQKITSLVIAGTNGKSLTAHFTGRLLEEEGLNVGTFINPHFTTYNERFLIKQESISNKLFTELGNEVLTMAYNLSLTPDTLTILTMMSFLYFSRLNIDTVIFESNRSILNDNPFSIVKPHIIGITRLSDPEINTDQLKITQTINDLLKNSSAQTHVVSADQNKNNLQTMEITTKKNGAVWHMAIRKIIPLTYPFEQIHGRCAALANRIASIFINEKTDQDTVTINTSLLAKQKARRGRPTLESKRQAEQQPKKTLEKFWLTAINLLPGRFEILEKEKPTVLLDTGTNLDALKNILLGIRLLHYKNPIKGLTLILGFTDMEYEKAHFLKVIRYFFKKTSGQIIICPVKPLAGHMHNKSFDYEALTNDIKGMKIKARYVTSLKDALEQATVNVDDQHGLITVTGSASIIAEYWKLKNNKK